MIVMSFLGDSVYRAKPAIFRVFHGSRLDARLSDPEVLLFTGLSRVGSGGVGNITGRMGSDPEGIKRHGSGRAGSP